MWNNIGRKLQVFAKVCCFVGIIGCIVTGIVLLVSNHGRDMTVSYMAVLIMVLGSLLSWIGSWAMYGLGLVVEHVENNGSTAFSSGSYNRNSSSSTHSGGTVSKGVVTSSSWKCASCGTINDKDEKVCTKCGCAKPSV